MADTVMSGCDEAYGLVDSREQVIFVDIMAFAPCSHLMVTYCERPCNRECI